MAKTKRAVRVDLGDGNINITPVKAFLDVDMGYRYQGLTVLLAENDLTIDAVNPGEVIVFLNTRRDKAWILCHGPYLVYLTNLNGVTPTTLARLPRAFNADAEVNLSDEMREILEGRKLGVKKGGPLEAGKKLAHMKKVSKWVAEDEAEEA